MSHQQDPEQNLVVHHLRSMISLFLLILGFLADWQALFGGDEEWTYERKSVVLLAIVFMLGPLMIVRYVRQQRVLRSSEKLIEDLQESISVSTANQGENYEIRRWKVKRVLNKNGDVEIDKKMTICPTTDTPVQSLLLTMWPTNGELDISYQRLNLRAYKYDPVNDQCLQELWACFLGNDGNRKKYAIVLNEPARSREEISVCVQYQWPGVWKPLFKNQVDTAAIKAFHVIHNYEAEFELPRHWKFPQDPVIIPARTLLYPPERATNPINQRPTLKLKMGRLNRGDDCVIRIFAQRNPRKWRHWLRGLGDQDATAHSDL